jgi:hypothetical protein
MVTVRSIPDLGQGRARPGLHRGGQADRELRNGRIRTAAVRRLIAIYRAEYRALLREERARLGGGANAA